MKKLTTGIFTVLLGLVAVDASAAITSKAYVDEKVGAVEGSVTQLTTTVNEFKEDIDNTIINQIKEELESDTSDIAKALAEKASASDVKDLTDRVDAAEKDIEDLQADVETLQGLTGNGEGSVTNQITNALEAYSTKTEVETKISAAVEDMETQTHAAATYATKTQVDGIDAAYKAADTEINAKIGTVAEGKTVVEMITDAAAGAKYDDTTVTADIKKNADAIAAMDTAYKAADASLTTAVEAAQKKADAAIPAPTATCTSLGAKCVLVVGNDGYAWEVIERGTASAE